MWPKLRKQIWKWRVMLITAPCMAGLAIAASSAGFFQLLEWATLDRFFRLRPLESPDPRIVIVTIDESDINHVGQWPVPDAILAQLIKNLKAQQPRAIGMDLYRNLPVEPGHQELIKVFKSTPNLIGVEKVAGDGVAPPPILSDRGQVGLADLVLDGDGKVRRSLLSVKPNKDGPTKLGLGVRLALMYLEPQGINLEMIDAKKKLLGLGKAVFVPFTGNDGGYVGADSGGYQKLLNFKGPPENFHTISMQDVLENQIPPNLLRDRIVYIGATGQSLNDLFFTPYSSRFFGSPKRTPGVVIHANITSEILSAAIDGRPFIQVWTDPQEWLWIFAWSFFGAIGSWKLLQANVFKKNVSSRWTVFSIGLLIAACSPIAGSYLAFLASWWIPTIAPLLAFTGSALAIAAYQALEWHREKADLEILLETTTEHYDMVAAELQDKAEKVVRESEKKLAQFLEAMPVGVAVVDANGHPFYTNLAAQQLLGKGVISDISSEEIAEVYQVYIAGTNQLYPVEKSPLLRALHGERSIADDLEIRRGDRIIPVESRGTPIYDESGNIIYAMAAFQDITDRKKSEVEREQFTNELFQLNRDLEQALEAEFQLTDAYGKFVPHEFLYYLGYESIVDVKLGDYVQLEMSILFSDIRDFTSLSESITPEDNFKFINAYLSRMESAIAENHGFIDKYIGDAIMALFSGSPDDAVRAGITMLQRLVEYNTTRGRPGRPQIQIGIGINTGSLMLGTVGGQNRMNGTVISDAVNLASRIEELTKHYGVSLLISHHTFVGLQDSSQYAIRLVDRVKVKGKSERVTVYEVFDADPPEIREGKLKTKTIFEQALLLYYMQSFREAAQLFEECLQINPRDKVVQIYLERCCGEGSDRT